MTRASRRGDGKAPGGLSRGGFGKPAWLVLLTLALLLALPGRASACLCPVITDPVQAGASASDVASKTADVLTQVAGWIQDAAEWASQAYQWVVKNMDAVMGHLIKTVSSEAEGMTTMASKQAPIDANAWETQKKITADISLKHLINVPDANGMRPDTAILGYNTGENACAMTNGNAVTVSHAVSDLTRALETFSGQSKMSRGALVAQSDLIGECLRGLRNPDDSRYGAKLIHWGCPSAATLAGLPADGNGFIDADTRPSTVLDPLHYAMPEKVVVNPTSGQIVIPYLIAPANDGAAPLLQNAEETKFAAAMYACHRFRTPFQLPPDSAVGVRATTTDPDAIEASLNGQAASDAINDVCVREVARRTRVSQTAASNGAASGILQATYKAEVKRCTQQNHLGIYNPEFKDDGITYSSWQDAATADLNDCIANGRSQLEMDRNEACKFDDPNYALYLAGTGMTVENHAFTVIRHFDDCLNFMRNLRKRDARISAAMTATLRESLTDSRNIVSLDYGRVQ